MQETITLYLDLKPGDKADFEIVGRTAAAFAETVKEVAFILEPGIEVRLEFESGTEGSLKLKALLTSLKTTKGRRNALIVVIGAIGVWLANDIRSYGFSKFLDLFFSPEQRQELSEEDVDRIARAVKDLIDGKIAKEPAREMFRQLEREEKIKSVGTTAKPDTKPLRPIQRTDFPRRAGIIQRVETSPRTRNVPSVERLLLISPVLLATDRVWRFRSFFGEFSYHVDDEKFRDSLLSGRRRLTMKAGIQLTAKIETHEVFEGGVWVPKERHIVKVVRVHKKETQPDLFSEPKKPKARKK